MTNLNRDQEQLLVLARTLKSQGVNTGQLRFGCRQTPDGVLHSGGTLDTGCSRPAGLKEKQCSRNLEKLLTALDAGLVCTECLKRGRFTESGDRTKLFDLLSSLRSTLAALRAVEDERGSVATRITRGLRLVKLAYRREFTAAGALGVRLTRRIEAAEVMVQGLLRSPEGHEFMLSQCAEVLVPYPDESLMALAGTKCAGELKDLVARQRRALEDAEPWVAVNLRLAHPSMGIGRTDLMAWDVFKAYRKSDDLVVMPVVVFQVLLNCASYTDRVVLPARPSTEVMEALTALYAPDASGPYTKLTKALAAAQALEAQ